MRPDRSRALKREAIDKAPRVRALSSCQGRRAVGTGTRMNAKPWPASPHAVALLLWAGAGAASAHTRSESYAAWTSRVPPSMLR